MKKYLVKRYIESIDPSEISVADRDYRENPQELIELYGMEEMVKVAENFYKDDDSSDIFRIKQDENGYFIITYSCVQFEEISEVEEIYEMFKFKLIEIDENLFESAHDPEIHMPEYEDCILIIEKITEE